MTLTAAHYSAIEEAAYQVLAEKDLREFVRQAWHVLEPANPFIDGWHIDAICEHLQAISDGQIRRLIINIPPRHGKSLIVSVFWPCWEWTTKPWTRWLFSSYALPLAIRDSVKCRRLIESRWYQERWGRTVSLTDDQNAKLRFDNTSTGYRLATSVSGSNTGDGGDRIVADDPNNVKEAESEQIREDTNSWWDEVMASRGNDPRTVARVIVQQRTHSRDLTGHVLTSDRGYEHLCLPAEYERDHPHKWERDPRKRDGDLLWPGHYGPKELAELKREMNSVYAEAGQLQQRPAPRTGGMFKREMFTIIPAMPANPIVIVRAWDNAASEGRGDFTAGALMAKYREGRFTHVVVNVVRGQWESSKRDAIKRQTASIDRTACGARVRVRDVQDPGSAGKDSARASVRNLAGFSVVTERPTGDKETRADPFASQQQVGNVALVEGNWNKDYIDELCGFPAWAHDDQVDASADAFNEIEKMPPSLAEQSREWGMSTGQSKGPPSLMDEIKRQAWAEAR